MAEGFAGAAVLGLALCSYATSVALHGNGFIAAFTGGLAFAAAGGPAAKLVPFVEETGTMLSLLVWLIFGVVAVVPALKDLTWQTVLYAVLSLTVIRMLPVAIALAGTRLGRPAVLFIGWFGPRGLASVVFGLLALEDLAEPAAKPAITVIAFTVLLSVLAHGLTADPLASRYGPRLTPPPGAAAPSGWPRYPNDASSAAPRPAGPEKKEIADDNRSGPDRGRPRRRIEEPARMPPSRQIRGNGRKTSPGGVPARPRPGAVMQPLAARRLGRFARPRRRLRAGLVQLLCALAGLGLGLLLPRITLDSTVASTRVTEALVAVGFGVLGLVTVIFSLLFLVVQWAFTSLSPRLNLFRDDPIVWRTFAFAVGVFVFSVTTALVIGDQQKVSVIVPAAEVAAVLAAIALIRTLQVKAFASIQLAPTLSAIAGQGRGIIDDLYRRPCPPGRQPAAPLPPRRRAVLWPHRQAILQQLDLGRLLRAADGAVIVLRAGMGDTLQQGAPVADLHGGEAADTAVLAGLVTGPERTFRQDPLFAFRLLADIAMRALSPAVNDPATAVQVLDTIESLLQALVSRDLDVAEVADDAGTVRVVLALPSWDDYLRTGLDDLIESAAQSPMVLLRARALLTTLLNAAPPARQPPITRRLQRAEQLGAGNFALIWHEATGTARRPSSAADQSSPAS